MTTTRPTERLRLRLRRLGVIGCGAIAGILLLITGFALTTLEAQMRIDAATAAVYLTPDQLEQLSEAGADDVMQSSYRDWLITAAMTSGGRVPTLVLEITDSDENVSWSWQPAETPIAGSIGGWQAKPLAALTIAGFVLVLGSLFLAAARWRPHPTSRRGVQHPDVATGVREPASEDLKLTDAARPGQTG